MSGDPKSWKVGLVGYGEVGRILSEDLRKAGIAVAAYDIKLDDDRAGPQAALWADAARRRSRDVKGAAE